MKGIVLAGGKGTRLYPLTYATNKHLLPVYDRPMVFYPLETLVKAGIKQIMVIVSGEHAGHFVRVLKNGKELGVAHLEYGYQENPVGGIADALSIAEDFADGKPITVILGDNTTDADISRPVKEFKDGAMVFLKEVPDPQRFGVPVFDSKGEKIIRIEEKPQKPANNFAVTGLYIYDNKVFDYIKLCRPSKRNELEITDVNNFYIKAGKLNWSKLAGFWRDAGTFQTIFEANKYWAEKKLKK
jgi:glucose-1-phosphate thymidylyltransferase